DPMIEQEENQEQGKQSSNKVLGSREELQSRNSTKNITADHNFSQIITIISLLGPSLNKKKRVMEYKKKIVMEIV
ncbi:hypothetical protein ACJX0J_014294, partial [Zea mays]